MQLQYSIPNIVVEMMLSKSDESVRSIGDLSEISPTNPAVGIMSKILSCCLVFYCKVSNMI